MFLRDARCQSERPCTVWTKNGVLFSEKNVRYTCALGALLPGDLPLLVRSVREAHRTWSRTDSDPSIPTPHALPRTMACMIVAAPTHKMCRNQSRPLLEKVIRALAPYLPPPL
jgi:hypothetical protein